MVGFDPSHSKSAMVELDLKILSILARSNVHQIKIKSQTKNQFLNANQMSKMYFLDNQKGERLETFQDDDLDDFSSHGSAFQSIPSNDVDLQVQIREGDINQDLKIYDTK